MISVIIPAYNAEKTIGRCIESVLKQKYPRKSEIIVVNDGSTDETKKIVSKYKNVRLINIENSGPAKARNTGIKKTKGDILLFIDSDCVADKKWMNRMKKSLEKNDIVTGKIVAEYIPESSVSKFLENDFNYRQKKKKGYTNFIFTANFGAKREIFNKYGLFDESRRITEDNEISYRIPKKLIFFESDCIVKHNKKCNMPRFFRESFRTGINYGTLLSKNGNKIRKDDHLSLKVLLEPFLSFLGILLFTNPYFFPIILIYILIESKFLSFVKGNEGIPISVSSFILIWFRGLLWSFGIFFGLLRSLLPIRV